MEIVIGVLVFGYGMLLGSFYNVVALRVPVGASIMKPRSHCTNCKQRLQGRDLIPIFSYLFLRGKCRVCKVHISPCYCIFETVTALGFLFSYILYGISPQFFLSILVVSLLVIISLSDLIYKIISNRILLVFAFLILILQLFSSTSISLFSAVLGSFFGFFLLWFITIISKDRGNRYCKLYAVIGLALGWKLTLLSLLIAVFLGILYRIYIKRPKNFKKKQEIPFGTMIAIATLFCLWFGDVFLL